MRFAELFQQVSQRLKWDAAEQVLILMEVISSHSTLDLPSLQQMISELPPQDVVPTLVDLAEHEADQPGALNLLALLDEESGPPVLPSLLPAWNFFNNSLTWAMVTSERLTDIPKTSLVATAADKMALAVPAEALAHYQAMLAVATPVVGFGEDELVGGFRLQYTDKDCLALLICNSPRGPYLEPLVVSVDTASHRVLTLNPRQTLLEPLQFPGFPYSIHVEGTSA